MAINKPQADLISAHTGHQIDLLRLSESLNRDIQPLLNQLQRELLGELASKDLTQWRRQRLESILAFSRSAIPDAYKEINEVSQAFLPGIAEFEQEFTQSTINTVTGIDLGAVLTKEQLSVIAGDTLILGAPSATWWARQDVSLTQKFADQMRIGFLEGEGVGALGRRVRSIMDVSRRDAETLARTSVQSVANEVREQLIEGNDDITNGYIHSSTLDNRTSFVCISRDNLKWNNKKEPVGHSKPFRRPPLHWNAVAKGEMVKTENGPKPIESVMVGERVYTHKGRLRPVYAVMSKPCDDGAILAIKTRTGKTVRVTKDHPVLTVGKGWIRADEIEVGDKLFNYTEKPIKVCDGSSVVIPNPKDYPSSFDTGEVFSEVLVSPFSMASSIKLDDKSVFGEGKIADSHTVDKLSNIDNPTTVEEIGKKPLLGNINGKLPLGLRLKVLLRNVLSVNRVISNHCFRPIGVMLTRILGKPISPMVFSSTLSRGLRLSHCLGGSFPLSPCFDSVPLAPLLDNSFANSKLSLNCSERLAKIKVLFFDKLFHSRLVSEINHFETSCVDDIRTVAHSGEVVNLAVKDDETYLVDGVVVHNCRSTMVPWLKSFQGLGAKFKTQVPEGTRVSMNGSVPRGLSYPDWLKQQPKKVQLDILGPKRWEMWQKDRLSLRQLVDMRGRPLTLEQIRAR